MVFNAIYRVHGDLNQTLLIGAWMITVLLADDHTLVLNGLQFLLETAEDIRIVATASNGIEAVAQAGLSFPDIAIIDISMPHMDGIEATRQICAHCPATRVMVLSMFDTHEYIQRVIEGGAIGYVLKEEINKDLIAAVRTVYKGDQYFSEKIASIAEQYIHHKGIDGQTH